MRLSLRSCGGGLLLEPIAEPLPETAQSIDEKPRFTRARQIMVGAGVANELRRNALFLQRHEPELRIAHRRPEVLFTLNEQRGRLHLLDVTDRRERVVHDLILPGLSKEFA